MANTPFLSEIRLFAFGFAPKGWTICAGQLLPINQNTALFSLLGTTYGGNGQTNFALPDLRGRVPAGYGQGPGLANAFLGDRAGTETVSVPIAAMPAHTHTVNPAPLTATLPCRSTAGNQRAPGGNVLAMEATGVTATYSSDATNATLGASAVVAAMTAATAGAGVPHNNMQPYLVLNYCIALVGIFPSQN